MILPSSRRQKNPRKSTLKLARLEPRQLLAADFQVTEFLASNSSGLVGDNGNSSDWIEIHNAGNTSGSLAGYTLTDDPTQINAFTFGAVNVPAGDYLVVYAADDVSPATGTDIYIHWV